jgi:hypothetical protein
VTCEERNKYLHILFYGKRRERDKGTKGIKDRIVGVLISLWLFLFRVFVSAAQPKEFFLDVLKKLEQRSHKCVELRGNM